MKISEMEKELINIQSQMNYIALSTVTRPAKPEELWTYNQLKIRREELLKGLGGKTR